MSKNVKDAVTEALETSQSVLYVKQRSLKMNEEIIKEAWETFELRETMEKIGWIPKEIQNLNTQEVNKNG